MSMGSMIGACNWWCRAGNVIRKVSKIASDLGVLPPFINLGVQAVTTVMGANNAPASSSTQTTQTTIQNSDTLNGIKKHYKIGRVPNVF
jgi:hypothetical protein